MTTTLTTAAEINSIEKPTHIVKCSGVREYAYVLSMENHKVFKKSWIKNATGDNDEDSICSVNESLPDGCKELSVYFTGKLKKSLSEFYLADEKVIGFTDMTCVNIPDAIFLQRISPKLKTFDMIFFYGSKYVEFNIVDKSDLKKIMSWFGSEIYSFGMDPLPLKRISTQLQNMKSAGEVNMYKKIYEELTGATESEKSESEYEPPSDESESESDSELDIDDYENDLGDTCNEEEDEEDEEEEDLDSSGEEEEYKVEECAEESDEEEEDEEYTRSNKRRKI